MSIDRDAEDQNWLRRLLSGDKSVANGFAQRMTPTIQLVVGRHLARRLRAGEVDDYVNETFVALYENDARRLRQFRPSAGRSVRSWVGLIASQTARNLTRSRHPDPVLPAAHEEPEEAVSAAPPQDNEVDAAALEKRLRGALDGEDERVLFDGLVDGLGAEELGIVLQINTDAVHSRIARLRRKLDDLVLRPTETTRPARRTRKEAS